MTRKAWLFAALLSAVAASAGAEEDARWRLRAREHFESGTARLGGRSSGYSTLGSTINFWREEPMKRAWGLALNFGGPKTDRRLPGAADKLGLLQLGLEYKRFFGSGPFYRLGAAAVRLDPRGASDAVYGASAYAGFGWEFPVGRLGLAPEVAVRGALLGDGASLLAFTPSFGVHFYVFPGDPKKR